MLRQVRPTNAHGNGETHGERSVAHGVGILGQHRHGGGDRAAGTDVQVSGEQHLEQGWVHAGKIHDPARDLVRTGLGVELLGHRALLDRNGCGSVVGQLSHDIHGQNGRHLLVRDHLELAVVVSLGGSHDHDLGGPYARYCSRGT